MLLHGDSGERVRTHFTLSSTIQYIWALPLGPRPSGSITTVLYDTKQVLMHLLAMTHTVLSLPRTHLVPCCASVALLLCPVYAQCTSSALVGALSKAWHARDRDIHQSKPLDDRGLLGENSPSVLIGLNLELPHLYGFTQ